MNPADHDSVVCEFTGTIAGQIPDTRHSRFMGIVPGVMTLDNNPALSERAVALFIDPECRTEPLCIFRAGSLVELLAQFDKLGIPDYPEVTPERIAQSQRDKIVRLV